jgi:hypothetical protein
MNKRCNQGFSGKYQTTFFAIFLFSSVGSFLDVTPLDSLHVKQHSELNLFPRTMCNHWDMHLSSHTLNLAISLSFRLHNMILELQHHPEMILATNQEAYQSVC